MLMFKRTIFAAIALCIALVCSTSPTLAWTHGSAAPSNPLASQRSVINVNYVGNYDYAYINMLHQGDANISPVGSAYAATASPWPQLLDAQGWPNNAAASGVTFGGSARFPSSANYAVNYVLTWDGDGTFFLTQGTCTEQNANTTWTRVSNCRWSNKAGQTAYIVFSLAGLTDQTLVGFSILATGGSQGFLRNLRLYRQGDEADLLAGKIFRTAFKQQYVDLLPSAIRFMNWHGGNNDVNVRWENRTTPDIAGYSARSNWVASPRYDQTSGTNQYTVPAVATGAKQTPATITQGEIATLRFGNSCTRHTSATVTAVQVQNIPQVTATFATLSNLTATISGTSLTVTGWSGSPLRVGMTLNGGGVAAGTKIVTAPAAGGNGSYTVNNLQSVGPVAMTTTWPFEVGDTLVIHVQNVPTGMMTKLNYFPVTVASVVDATHFTINADTTTWGAFSGTALADQFVTLDIGSRGAFPITFLDAQQPACHYGEYFPAGVYKSLVFNKNVAAKTDGAGNWVYGVWLYDDGDGGWSGNVPIEIAVALVNEVNALALSQGITTPIHMWANIPFMGLTSIDPDYSAGSNFAVNMLSTIFNGSTVNSVTYAPLTSRASLLVELNNETWNQAGGVYQTALMKWQGYQRWPASGVSDFTDMATLRSTAAMRDIYAQFGANPRIKRVLGGWGSQGIATNSSNRGRVYGNASAGQLGNWYTTDTLVTSGSWGTPISNHEAFATASYFTTQDSYYTTTTGTGTFTDDVAMYNGTNNTGNGGGNYSGAANPTQAVTNFVNHVKSDTGSGNQSIDQYAGTLRPAYAAALPVGVPSIEYEGGADWQVRAGNCGTQCNTLLGAITTNQSNLLRAALNSTQWGTAQTGYFNTVAAISNAAMPSVYLSVAGTSTPPPGDQRWGYASPDSYASGTEGQALLNNGAWVAMGSRNHGLSP